MKISRTVFLCVSLFLSISYSQQKFLNEQSDRAKLLMDFNWRFSLGHAHDVKKDFDYGTGWINAKAKGASGAISNDFIDTAWRKIDLPHDWAVEQEFVNVPEWEYGSHGFKAVGYKFPETSIGWYRKSFTIPNSDRGKRITIKFDGVFRDCTVWLNGYYLGNNISGYNEFSYDVTDFLNYDKQNVLVVRVDASQFEGWFYEGAGIYRHAWLIKTNSVHIPLYGTYVTTDVKGNNAEINIETEIENKSSTDSKCRLHSFILDEKERVVAETLTSVTIDKNDEKKVKHSLDIKNPLLWSIENPKLYKLVSIIENNGKVIDRVETNFGIRTIRWDKDKGFFLNGKHVKIQGVCCHQDHAGVGSALPDRLQYYRIELLKEMGCNAYRTSHNPPTTELLEACDRLGMLVLDENRLLDSSPEMLKLFETLMLRDRNHPSIIAWSIGNEEWNVQTTEQARNIAVTMMQLQKEIDPSRLSTYAANTHEYNGINSVIDLRGFNYINNCNIDKYRAEHPEQILWGTEEGSTLCTRGIYQIMPEEAYVRDYDIATPSASWTTSAEKFWTFYDEREWLAGGFVWTGFDYRGEPTPYTWPNINSHFGIMDMCGFPKNIYYYYQAWWSNKDVLHLFPHWNWTGKVGDTIDVWCNSNCESVELFLNGKSLGKKNMVKNGHHEWKVIYEPGVLEARGIRNGKEIIEKIETTGQTFTVKLVPDRNIINADGEDLSIVNVIALDEKGREVPTANESLVFELKGKGKIIGAGNGNPSSHEMDKVLSGNYKRSLFNGKCQVIIQSTKEAGEIVLTAKSEKLKTAEVTIKTNSVPLRAAVL
ncbi:MAG: beta-galactosidase GalA [Bacteroidota bacterium]